MPKWLVGLLLTAVASLVQKLQQRDLKIIPVEQFFYEYIIAFNGKE